MEYCVFACFGGGKKLPRDLKERGKQRLSQVGKSKPEIQQVFAWPD